MATFMSAMGAGLAKVGGGSVAAGAANVAGVAVAGASAYSQIQAGKHASIEAKQAREAEKLKANEEAIGRRERLIRALAQQNASIGARGISQSGSPTQVMLQDVEQFEREDMAQSTMSKMRQRNLKAAGQNARRSGNTGAGVSLLNSAADHYQAHGK